MSSDTAPASLQTWRGYFFELIKSSKQTFCQVIDSPCDKYGLMDYAMSIVIRVDSINPENPLTSFNTALYSDISAGSGAVQSPALVASSVDLSRAGGDSIKLHLPNIVNSIKSPQNLLTLL